MPSSANGSEEKHENFWKEWIKAGIIVALAVFLYRTMQSAEWISGLGTQSEKLTLGISFLVGIAASLSTCLAVVGGMVIAFSEKYKNNTEDNFARGVFLPNLKFHIGRILTFFVLGGLLGLIGGTLNLSGNFVSVWTIVVAVVMGWLGLSILGIAPSISSLGVRPPKFILRFWGKLENTEHKAAPYLLGGITFFLPCGFTQSMQIFALASGDFWTGAFVLSAFALGTMPVLLALGATASWANFRKITFVNKAAGAIVILFAIYTLNSGLAIIKLAPADDKSSAGDKSLADKLAGKNIRANTSDDRSEVKNGAVQKVEMKITNRGFEPSVLRVKNGIPVEFSINGDGATGCTNQIVIPELGIEKDIKRGENIIGFTPKKVGPIVYSCWMGMVRGKIIVE